MKRAQRENETRASKKSRLDSQASSSKEDEAVLKPSWSIEEELAKTCDVPKSVAKSFTNLLSNDCTLPFIARYRKEAVGNLEIEELRKLKVCYEELGQVQSKISTVLEKLSKQNLLTNDLSMAIRDARDLEEVELHYAPLKESKKKTLAARAKELGLEDLALHFLEPSKKIKLEWLKKMVNKEKPGLETLEAVKQGIQHILADTLAKDPENLRGFDTWFSRFKDKIEIRVIKSRSASKKDAKDFEKFEKYFDKSFKVSTIKPHTFLAISRGEGLKILSIKVDLLELDSRWIRFLSDKYKSYGCGSTGNIKEDVMWDAFTDAAHRILEPMYTRRVLAKLKSVSHQASIESFSRNLKCLLLTPPLRNTAVLGLDPGFKHGCKCAAVAPDGQVLRTETVHIQFNSKNANQPAASALRRIVKEYQCAKIAIGNGTACRETEAFVADLIQNGSFKPIDVQYIIINEAGASIYSCSQEARQEFPDLDPNLISAVSIARRLQDPLTEYVRVSPQNLGIGMYQHDIPVKKLNEALDDVVTECVSFVGVDVNTCPLHVLSKVAGLTPNRAKKIIEHRNKNGPFINRRQLMSVASIGAKTFEQCAGFLTICPNAASLTSDGRWSKGEKGSKKRTKDCFEFEPLDQTCVHPESYDLAKRIVNMFGGDVNQIGQDVFIRKLSAFSSVKSTASELNEPEAKVAQIVASLSQPLDFDFRDRFERPLFKKSVASLSDLKVGQRLTGRVSNVTDFGAFVDVGVGRDGLLHSSAMRAGKEVQLGMRVNVRVLNMDKNKEKFNLQLAD